ncbi:MAG: CesT family type III secretion system chaperone [Pirellulales bacterium]|nr:CesT family type III secretion system chaperone [Pirellulales bacterium]
MKPLELIDGLRRYLQISRLEPDHNGVYTIVFDDGLDIDFIALNDNLLLIRSSIAGVPEDPGEHASFYRDLLQANLRFLRDQTASLSFDEESNQVWLGRTIAVRQQDLSGFCDLVEDFVNTLQWWRGVASQEAVPVQMPADFRSFNMLRP